MEWESFEALHRGHEEDKYTGCPRRKDQYSGRSYNRSFYKKKNRVCTCVLFRTVSEIELFHCTVPKLLIRKRYYVSFLIPVFIFQSRYNLPSIIPFRKFHHQHQCTFQSVWGYGVLLVCTEYSVLYSEIDGTPCITAWFTTKLIGWWHGPLFHLFLLSQSFDLD
jgi:hypothetical protein